MKIIIDCPQKFNLREFVKIIHVLIDQIWGNCYNELNNIGHKSKKLFEYNDYLVYLISDKKQNEIYDNLDILDNSKYNIFLKSKIDYKKFEYLDEAIDSFLKELK